MKEETFKEQVRNELEGLSTRQVVEFAYRGAMRALPMLGEEGHLDFWKEKMQGQHLYAVFRALDVSAGYTYAAAFAFANIDAYAAANAANAAFANTYAAAVTAYAAAFAADAALALADAASFAATVAANADFASAVCEIDLKNDLLKDIEAVKNNTLSKIDIKQYGLVWGDFQTILINLDCEYWAKLYTKIFEQGFVQNRASLEQRLSVPEEIQEQGAAAVGHYLQELEKGALRLNEARIIILGDKGAGKTCVARRLIDPAAPMTTLEESTAGVDTSVWQITADDEKINASIWDFAGHTVTHAVHQFFLSERCLYIMVYDGRTEGRKQLTYWLDHMKNFGGDSKAFILINKKDPHKVNIPINYLKEQYPIAGIYDFSVQEDKVQLEQFRTDVAEHIKHNPSWEKQEIPVSYYQVKSDLEKLFRNPAEGKPKEHISRADFDAIAKKYEVEDIDKLLINLHALGVSLWYKDMADFGSLVLNPEWISHGVYKIINWVSNEKKNGINKAEFVAVFKDQAERYPAGKCHGFLFNLMKRYELAYETSGGKRLIIPHLLKEDQPANLPTFEVGESLKLQYRVDQPLPPNTISRFIVRHHEQIRSREEVWRYGVILKDDQGSIALVREEDRTISVSVKGPSQSTFISTLRATLNDIFSSYKSKKPTLEYRIKRYGEIKESLPAVSELYLPEPKILNHVALDEPYFDDVTNQRLPLNKEVHIYKIEGGNNYFGSQVQNLTHNTFNFKDSNVSLQGNLMELSQLLEEDGHSKEAKRLVSTAKLLEQAEEAKTVEEVKKKGIAGRLKRFAEELGDEDSKLRKVIDGVDYGIDVVQDIAKNYNKIAQWVGLPQVPKPLLGEEDE